MSTEHLWEAEDRNIFEISGLREFVLDQGWKAFVEERERHTNSAFLGPMLWHYWSTPSHDCEMCTDDIYCYNCGKGKSGAAPSETNQMWLCYAMQPGNTGAPYLYIINVERTDEPDILQWLRDEYRQRGLCLGPILK